MSYTSEFGDKLIFLEADVPDFCSRTDVGCDLRGKYRCGDCLAYFCLKHGWEHRSVACVASGDSQADGYKPLRVEDLGAYSG